MIVTIDGPAGSGKSTTARAAADHLQYVYLDTGAMYRTLALGVIRAGAGTDEASVLDVLPSLDVGVEYDEDGMRLFLGQEEVTDQIRTSAVGEVASEISSIRDVRERLVREQRRIGFEQEEIHGGVILDGRDTDTVVFPEADVKVYMVADVDVRARRRRQEYLKNGEDVSLEQVRREIEERDRRDRNREIAPLRRAEDAVLLDTTDRSIEEQVAFVVDRVKQYHAPGTSTEGAQ